MTLFFNFVYYLIWFITLPLRQMNDVAADSRIVATIETVSSWLSVLRALPVLSAVLAALVVWGIIETIIAFYKPLRWILQRLGH